MMLIIKDRKSKELKSNLYAMKNLICDIMECIEEAHGEDYEEYGRHHTRHDVDMKDRDYDYDREMTRGRGRGRY